MWLPLSWRLILWMCFIGFSTLQVESHSSLASSGQWFHDLVIWGIRFCPWQFHADFIVPKMVSFSHKYIHPGKLTAGTQEWRWMVQMIFLFKQMIFSFQPFIFRGVKPKKWLHLYLLALQKQGSLPKFNSSSPLPNGPKWFTQIYLPIYLHGMVDFHFKFR